MLDGIDWEDLESREGTSYLKDSDTPYTGKTYQLHPNGEKKWEKNWKDGKPEGLDITWYQSGQKWREWNFKNHKPEGKWTYWDENGLKQSEANYKNGKQHGINSSWYENG